VPSEARGFIVRRRSLIADAEDAEPSAAVGSGITFGSESIREQLETSTSGTSIVSTS